MNKVYLGLGANIGDKIENIRRVIKDVFSDSRFIDVKYSSLYESVPYGEVKQENFINGVISFSTNISLNELFLYTKELENNIGRIKRETWGPREIDIDILLYGNFVVENEKPAADKILRLLKEVDISITVLGIVETVEEAVNRLQENPKPDLILMDIQLDDGLCFEIFEIVNVDTPVIFTTAYDEYTLKAFKVNSVDYLLKPIDEESFRSALAKYQKLYANNDPFKRDFKQLMNEFRNQHKSRFLIKIGDKYRSVPTREISHFHICERNVFLNDYQGKDYGVDYSLDQLQNILDPRKFFRINRECIVNIDTITLMHSYSSSRLQLILKNREKSDLFVVSRDKVANFKRWVDK